MATINSKVAMNEHRIDRMERVLWAIIAAIALQVLGVLAGLILFTVTGQL